jgi:hypothetical protein
VWEAFMEKVHEEKVNEEETLLVTLIVNKVNKNKNVV